MKSLILKDVMTLAANLRSMVLVLLFLAVMLIPGSGADGYIFASAIICSTMVVSTFAFDERSRWEPFALTMPIRRSAVPAAKFLVLLLFSAAGSLWGLGAGCVYEILTAHALSLARLGEMAFLAMSALSFGMIFGGMVIPLILRFGTEKGRILMIASFTLPAGVCYLAYQLLTMLGIPLTEDMLFTLLCCTPLIALVWDFVMYRISVRLFAAKEF